MLNWKIRASRFSSADSTQTPKEDSPTTTTGNTLDRKGRQVRRLVWLSDVRDGRDIAPRFPVPVRQCWGRCSASLQMLSLATCRAEAAML